jgi:pyridoxine/pyridoxamine 5'-phosphate oxidase
MKIKKARLNTFDGILEDAWKMLLVGADRSDDPFHWPVLGSTGQQGCNLRTVILRQVLVPQRMLVCHTDARAPKADEIQVSDRVAWLFYHPIEKVQLRIYGQATLHRDDAMADEQWAAASVTSRLNYATSQSPGTPVKQPTSGLPDILRNKLPTLLESETVRPYFMAIACHLDAMDWLQLNPLGNRRARFSWDNKDGLQATWLVP